MSLSWNQSTPATNSRSSLCYLPQSFKTETARIEYLFELYNEYTAPLVKVKKKKGRRK